MAYTKNVWNDSDLITAEFKALLDALKAAGQMASK
jgi:hypothetical protein